jgi:hypothetical protein
MSTHQHKNTETVKRVRGTKQHNAALQKVKERERERGRDKTEENVARRGKPAVVGGVNY